MHVVSKPALAMGLGGIMYHGENFEKMTQYSEFGCIFLHNYAFKFLISYINLNIL